VKGAQMDEGVKALYINLLGFKLSPKRIFTDWNRYKMAAAMAKVDLPSGNKYLYPDYVKMAVKYEVK
jgi:hypothetical protein